MKEVRKQAKMISGERTPLTEVTANTKAGLCLPRMFQEH